MFGKIYPQIGAMDGAMTFKSTTDQSSQERYPSLMSITAERLVDEALDLPLQVRAFVAEKLIESLDDAPSPVLSSAWKKEIKKRCQEIDKGLVGLRSAEDVFTTAYAAL